MAWLSLGVSGVTVAWAQPGPIAADRCARPERLLTQDDREAIGRVIFQRAKERLGLSDQQAEEIQAMLQSRRDEVREDLKALCEARVELRQLLDRQDSDPVALKAAAQRVKAVQGKLLDRRLEAQVAIRSKLTADQWARWLEFRKSMARRWMGHVRRFAS
jgi:DNA repair ATPase RecN